MSGVNKVILVGNLGADPEVKYFDQDNAVARVNLATTERYKDKNGQRQEQTEWHNVELWGGLAKIAETYLKKGMTIYVEGKIKTDQWTDNNGNQRYTTKIRALNMTMLGGNPRGGESNQAANPSNNQSQAAPMSQANEPEMPNFSGESESDDLPF
ncbi:MAG: single-stranded DNA-binding protein [Cyclobacteriaceae bacterium]|nr:single-stranded DNA-binding protein [Cyclobacteriaceae bacterium]MCH8517375.1 single-stranded DNA-binding protein [Cyclobacteriaceae bacterium]